MWAYIENAADLGISTSGKWKDENKTVMIALKGYKIVKGLVVTTVSPIISAVTIWGRLILFLVACTLLFKSLGPSGKFSSLSPFPDIS